jgi:hypothetical protein
MIINHLLLSDHLEQELCYNFRPYLYRFFYMFLVMLGKYSKCVKEIRSERVIWIRVAHDKDQ